MARDNTDSFITEIPLAASPSEEKTILKRFEMARRVYNACLGEILRRAKKMRDSGAYQAACKMPRGEKGSPEYKARQKAFQQIRIDFGFREYDLHGYATRFSHSYLGDHLDSNTVQKLATRAYEVANQYVLGKRGKPRFKGCNQFDSVEGKSNKSGILWREDQVKWLGLELKAIIPTDDPIIAHGLSCRVKYVRIVRRKLNDKNRFYVQLVNEGKPYQKPKNKLGDSEMGLDLGPSAIAAVELDGFALLEPFCPELADIQAEITRLQRQIERQRRANNPDNYNPARWVPSKGGKRWIRKKGTVKTGCRSWIISNQQRANERRLAELYRKQAAHRKSRHGALANRLLRQAGTINLERVSYKAWQKIFGTSVQFRAPGTFVSLLRRKAESAGGRVNEFPTRDTRLSQICLCGCVEKKSLSQRWHYCSCGIMMQRDLFSAFLALFVENNTLNANKAREFWSGLEPGLRAALSQAAEGSTKSANGKAKWPASFGLGSILNCSKGRRQSGSPRKSDGIPAKSLQALLQETVG